MKRFTIVALVAGFLAAPGILSAGWTRVDVPMFDVKSLSFPVGRDTGFACGNGGSYPPRYISMTVDGGATWSLLPDTTIHMPMYSVTFPTGTVTGFTGGFVSGHDGVIYRTTNSGATWDSVGHGYVTSLSFAPETDSIGWAAAFTALYKTTDAGENWSYHQYPDPYGRAISVKFINSATGWICGSSGAIFKTTNSGVSWTSQYSQTHYNLQAISFPTADTGFIAGESVVLRTVDGGAHWDSVHVYAGYDTSYHSGLCAVQFPTGTRVGYACGDYRIYKTTDGGLTWFNLVAGMNDYYLCLNFTDDYMGCVGGAYQGHGFVLRTTDGGTGVEDGPSVKPVDARGRLGVSPNPFSSSARILGHEREMFEVYDVSGRKVGTFVGRLIGEGLSPGVYFVRTEAGKVRPEKIVKLK